MRAVTIPLGVNDVAGVVVVRILVVTSPVLMRLLLLLLTTMSLVHSPGGAVVKSVVSREVIT